MKKSTVRIVKAAIEADGDITPAQAQAALDILHGTAQLRHTVDIKDLVKRIVDAVKTLPHAKKYLRKDEAAGYMGCSVRFLGGLLAKGQVPYHRLGNKIVVFKRTDLDAYMQKRRVERFVQE